MAEPLQKALVTGASGFIGWHVIRALQAQNVEVAGMVRHSSDTSQLDELEIELRCGDLSDPASLKRAAAGCDTVFHLAGLTKASASEALMRVNAQGTADLARACQALANPPTLVYASSLAAAGPTSPDSPLLEWDTPVPVSDYGRSKLAGEEALRQVADRLAITIVRPPIVFGERDPGTLQMFKALHHTRVHVIPGYRRKMFSLIYGADLAELCIAAARSGERLETSFENGQGVYFTESRTRLTYRELGTHLGQALGHHVTIPLPLPHFVVRMVGSVAEMTARSSGRVGYLSRDKAREATAGSWICDADKALRQLGFEPPAGIREKLAKTVHWYREHGWL